MVAARNEDWLSEEEIEELTGYKMPAYQLRFLRENGITASLRRRTNTVLVLRMHLRQPGTALAARPALKSSRR